MYTFRLQYMWRYPLAFYFPLLIPFHLLGTLLAVTGSVHPCPLVARKLTSPSSTPSHSLPIPNSQYPGYLCTPLRRLQDSSFSCPEQYLSNHTTFNPFQCQVTVPLTQFKLQNLKIKRKGRARLTQLDYQISSTWRAEI
jgi:hypothetical protein